MSANMFFMSSKKEMSELEIASKLKAGKRFVVQTIREQKRALTGAKFLGIEIKTETLDDDSIAIKFVQQ
jgi:hypothetical protein